MLSDTRELESVIDRVLPGHLKAVADFTAARTKSMGFLLHQVHRATQGKANPQTTRELIVSKVDKL